MGDGSTARARYPFPAGSDPMEGVENLLRDKRRTGSLLAVDSLDDLEEAGTDLYVVVQHIVAATVQKGFDLIAAAGRPQVHLSGRIYSCGGRVAVPLAAEWRLKPPRGERDKNHPAPVLLRQGPPPKPPERA
jgi:hypothetical protein